MNHLNGPPQLQGSMMAINQYCYGTPLATPAPSTPVLHAAARKPNATSVVAVAAEVNNNGGDEIKEKIPMRPLDPYMIASHPLGANYAKLADIDEKQRAFLARKSMESSAIAMSPPRMKYRLRIFAASRYFPAGIPDHPTTLNGDATTGLLHEMDKQLPGCEIRVEGRVINRKCETIRAVKRKFSTMCKSIVIELDRDVYGPDNHILEWKQTGKRDKTDGFCVRRPGDRPFNYTVYVTVDYPTPVYRVDPRLANFIGLLTIDPDPKVTRHFSKDDVVHALWTYIKRNRLLDPAQPEFVLIDRNLASVFDLGGDRRFKVCEIATRVQRFLYPPDPVVIRQTTRQNNDHSQQQQQQPLHPSQIPPSFSTITDASVQANLNVTTKDVEIEFEDPFHAINRRNIDRRRSNQASNDRFNQEIAQSIAVLNAVAGKMKFMDGLATDPQKCISNWFRSQSSDLQRLEKNGCSPSTLLDPSLRKAMRECKLGANGQYFESNKKPWIRDAVRRYLFNIIHSSKVQHDRIMPNNDHNEE